MNLITSLLSRGWHAAHLVLIILLSIVLTAGLLGANIWLSELLLDITYRPFDLIKSSVVELYLGASEGHQLREALVDASVKLSLLEEAERENSRLRAVLGFEPPPQFEIVPARVTAVYGGKLPIAAVINRGTADSVLMDQPIINQYGLIGRITSVSTNFATVQLLTAPQNRVAARVARSREMGIVKYISGEGMILNNFSVRGDIEVGDIILSSGLGGIYPYGLQVGVVAEVERPEREPFCRIKLIPAVNFHTIEELFILHRESP